MKNIIALHFFFFLSFFNIVIAQDCLPAGITFTTQKQIDNFPTNYPGCTQILNDVQIRESLEKSITNLDSLYQIIKIKGNLSIDSNISLTSLSGLKNLNAIEGNFIVWKNASLFSLNGLKNLNSLGGSLMIWKNKSLTNLNGLDNLTTINKNLMVNSNPKLLSLNGLEGLTSIKGNINLINNKVLPTLSGLNNLNAIEGNFIVWKNASLKSMNGLDRLTSIGGYMDVENNASLINLDDLNRVNVVGKKIKKNTTPKKPHKLWITTMDNSSRFKGYLREVGDSMIMVSKNSNTLSLTGTQSLNFKNIKEIKYRKKGKIANSILIGALAGFAIGGGIGWSAGDDKDSFIFCLSAQEKAIITGVGLSIPGALIGGIIGSMKIKIPINGNHKTFKKQKEELQKFRILN